MRHAFARGSWISMILIKGSCVGTWLFYHLNERQRFGLGPENWYCPEYSHSSWPSFHIGWK